MGVLIDRYQQQLRFGLVAIFSVLVVFALARINSPDDSVSMADEPMTEDLAANPATATIGEAAELSQAPRTPAAPTTLSSDTQQSPRSAATTPEPSQPSDSGASRPTDTNTPLPNIPTTTTSSATTTTTTTQEQQTADSGADRPTETETPATINLRSNTENEFTTTWRDDFKTLDTSRWVIENNTNVGGGNECYLARNATTRNGNLVLTAKNEDVTCRDGDRSQTSAMIRSRDFTFSPGQVLEFRAKLTPADHNNQAGLNPAVWSAAWAGSWPLGGEANYLEVATSNRPASPLFAVHTQNPAGVREIDYKFFGIGENFSNDWHTIRVEYRTGDLRWFIDGDLAHTVTNANTAQGWPAPFDQTIRDLRINLAVGGQSGALDPEALGADGATFEIEYIQVANL